MLRIPREARARSTPQPQARVVPLPRPALDDADLLIGVARGEPAAIAELIDRYSPLLRRILIRTLGSAQDIDDLLQDVFLIILRRARAIRKPDALRSFVVGVAIRVARNELRKRALRRWVGLDQAGELPESNSEDPATSERLRALYRVLDRMGAPTRTLFVLRYVENMELGELALATGCSLSTIKRRLARADKQFSAMACREPALDAYLRSDP